MEKLQLLERVFDTGIIAIVRLASADVLSAVTDAIAEGGVRCIEFTMTTPGALDTLAEATARYGKDVSFGAGTVLDPETARAAILAGAQFIVAPNLNPDVITLCNRYSIAAMPGALTPTEIVQAWELGADVVKVFPADSMGPRYIKGVLAPLPHIKLAPVGGITQENAIDYIRAGAACLGVGSSLVNNASIAEHNWTDLTIRARAFIDAVFSARA